MGKYHNKNNDKLQAKMVMGLPKHIPETGKNNSKKVWWSENRVKLSAEATENSADRKNLKLSVF